uniref:RHS repeat-associated core domain-containing protein n=1 Tax=Paenibacillus campi TaxID=3106031 RepID=UPI002AFE96C6
ADGTQEHRTYDAAGQLTGLTVLKPDGSTMAQTGYTYDADGNVVNEDGGEIDLPAGSVNDDVYGPGLSPAAGSDAAASGNGAASSNSVQMQSGGASTSSTGTANGQMSATAASTAVQADVYTGAGTGSPPTNPTVTQDTYGLLGDLTMTYTADNRLATVNGQAVQYDAEGNMLHGPLQGSLQDYHYDARNRLIAAGGVSYGYDNENNRTSITVNGVTTKQIINPQAVLSQVLMETDGNGNPTAWYVYGLGLISRYDARGTMQTYHYDLRGSTIALTDAKGNVTDTYTYDTYGEERSHDGTTNQPFQYDGRDGVQTDPNGLYQMRSRYYNPEIRRFVNRDVVTGTIADGLTMNRYAYVNGNPVSYVDPFGLSAEHSDAMRTGFSMALDAIPFVGTVKGIQEVLTGVDWITGQQLSVADRVAEGAGVLLSVLPEGKLWGTLAAKEAIDGGEWLFNRVVRSSADEVAPSFGRKMAGDNVGVMLRGTGNTVDSVPSVRNGEFNNWFNSLTPDEFDQVWADSKLRDTIKDRLRHPGGLHEWHLVSRADVFKRWGVTSEQIAEMRTLISDTKFVNPVGKHGGKGSTKAHNELLEIIDSSTDYDMFKRRLQNWANYRFDGGVDALPDGLQP